MAVTDYNITLKIAADIGAVRKVVDGLTRLSKISREAAGDVGGMAAKAEQSAKALNTASAALKKYNGTTVKTQKDLKELAVAIRNSGAAFNDANVFYKTSNQALMKQKGALAAAKKEWNLMGRAVRGQPKTLQQVARNLRQVDHDLKSVGHAGIATKSSLQSLQDGSQGVFRRALTDAEKYRVKLTVLKQGLHSVAQAHRSIAKDAQWVGRQMIVGITLPLGIAAQKLISQFSSVETEFGRIAKVLGDPAIDTAAKAMDRYGDSVKRISKEFAVSQSLTAGVMGDFAAQGETVNLEQFTELAQKIAMVGEMDVSEATGLITSLRQTFGLEGEALEKTLDVMNEIENKTPLLFSELAEAFPQVAGAAEFLNIEIEETAALMAGMKASGFDASEAAHALKFGLTRMAAGPKVAGEALKTLGVELFNTDGTIKPMLPVLKELGGQLSFLNNDFEATETQLKAMEDLFGTRQIARMGAALRQVGEDGSAFERAMEASATALGSVDDEAKIVQDTLTFKLSQAKIEIQQVMADLGEIVIEPAIAAFKAFSKFLQKVNELPDGIKKLIVYLGALAAALGPIIFSFAMVGVSSMTALAGLTKLIPGLGGATKELGKELLDESRLLIQIGDGLFDLGKDTEDVSKTIAAAEDTLRGYAKQVGYTADEIDDLVVSLHAMGNEVPGKLTSPGNVILTPGDGKNEIVSNEELMKRRAAAGGDGGLDIIPANIGKSTKDAADGLDDVADSADDVADATKKIGGSMDDVAEKATKGKLGKLDTFLTKVIIAPFRGVWKILKSVGGAFVRFGKNVIAGFGALKGVGFKGIFGGLKNIVPKVLQFAKVGLKLGVIATVITLVILAIKSLSDHWDSFYKAIKPGLDAVGEAWSKLSSAFGEAMKTFSLFGDSYNNFSSSNDGGGFWADFGNAISWVMEEILVPFINLLSWFAENVLPDIIRHWARMWQILLDIVDGVINGDLEQVLLGFGKVIYETIGRPMVNLMGFLVEAAVIAGAAIVEALANGPGNWMDEQLSKLGSIYGAGSRAIWGDEKAEWAAGTPEIVIDASNAGRTARDAFTNAFHNQFGAELKGGGKKPFSQVVDDAGDAGDDAAEEFETEFNPQPEIDNEAWDNAFKGFVSRVYSNVEKIIDDIKKSAVDALKEHHENILELYELSIDAINDTIEKEKKLQEEREYLARRREMLEDRALQRANYQKNRALAIYEGRIDDARMIDLEERKNARDHAKSLGDLEADRQQAITDALRDAEKERIKIEQDAHAERLKMQEDAFQKQLDLITKYTPLNVAQFNDMMGKINGAMFANGVAKWPLMAEGGMAGFRSAINDANEGIMHEAAVAGKTSASNWLASFMSGDLVALEGDGGNVGNVGNTQSGNSNNGSGYNYTYTPYRGDPGQTSPHRYTPYRGDPGDSYNGPVNFGRRGDPTFHAGGSVGGKGDIPATLEGGEYVIKKTAVNKFGTRTLDSINQGKNPSDTNPSWRGGKSEMGGPTLGWANKIKAVMSAKLQGITKDFMGKKPSFGSQGPATIGGVSLQNLEDSFYAGAFPIGGLEGGGFGPGGIPGVENIKQMANYILSLFGGSGAYNMGDYVYRNIAGTNVLSEHAKGLAVDIGGPTNVLHDVFNWALGQKNKLGLKTAIWQNDIWSLQRGMRRGGYRKNDHYNHVHLDFLEGFGQMFGLGGGFAGPSVGSNIAKAMVKGNMSKYGWGDDQWGPLHQLIQGESGWNPNAKNPTSSAWGLFQFLDMHKKPGGYLPYGNNSNLQQQIDGGLRYIKEVYGSPGKALSKWQSRSPHWYHEGGLVKMMKGGLVPKDNFPASLHKGEMVLPRQIAEKVQNGADGGGQTNIYVDTFIGEEAWFRAMMDKHDIKIKKPYQMAQGGGRRKVTSYNR